MKVCILSMQRVPNFGSLLQSLGLKQILEEMGHTVSFLDIEKIEQDYQLLKAHSPVKTEQQSKIQKITNKIKKIFAIIT